MGQDGPEALPALREGRMVIQHGLLTGVFLAMRTLILKVYRPEQPIPAGDGVQAR